MGVIMLGAIIGDICGSSYEYNPARSKEFELLCQNSRFTDDTILTIAVADSFMNNKDLITTIKEHCYKYPKGRGYGLKFYNWLGADNPQPYGSYGNGSAMRVSSIGWLYNTEEEVLEFAKQSAEVTHNHIEGIKGAQAVALAIFLARQKQSKEQIKIKIETLFGYDLDRTLEEIGKTYKFDMSCQGSVPEAIIAFLESNDYESAIRNAIWLKGDADTQACIAGAIAEAYYEEIPEYLKDFAYKLLPDDINKIISQYYIKKVSNFLAHKYKYFQFEKDFETIDLLDENLIFDSEQFSLVKNGFIAMEMEDKLDIFYDDKSNRLFVNQAWGDQMVYIVYFEAIDDDCHQIIKIEINAFGDQLNAEMLQYESRLCLYVILTHLLGIDVDFPVNPKYEHDETKAVLDCFLSTNHCK